MNITDPNTMTVAQLRAEINGHPRVTTGDTPLPGLSKFRKADLIALLEKLDDELNDARAVQNEAAQQRAVAINALAAAGEYTNEELNAVGHDPIDAPAKRRAPKPRKQVQTRAERAARGTRKYRRESMKARKHHALPGNYHRTTALHAA
jgi:hypothetical protein